MPPPGELFTGIIGLLGILASVLSAVFIYGKLTQRVTDQDVRIGKIEVVHVVHSERIGEHDVKIGKIEEWKSGFSTGVKVTGNQTTA